MTSRLWRRQQSATRGSSAVARLAVVGMAVGALAASGCSVSPDDEEALGAADAATVDSQVPLIHDTLITEYVAALGRSMAARTERGNLAWHFSVVNSSDVNAFALPGGYIYVNRGAIEQADRLDEIAGIMGHEIGHVVKRHSVQQIQGKERQAVELVLLCTLTRICHTIGGRLVVKAGADALSAKYSQHDEAEADSEGVVNTLRVGIDPEGLPAFFEKLFEEQKRQPSLVEAFFSTHPSDETRVAATRRQIAGLRIDPKKDLVRDTPEFHAIQALVRAWPAPPKPDSTPVPASR